MDLIELEIALGHRPLSKTSSRYAILDPNYLNTIKHGIEEVYRTSAAWSVRHFTQNSRQSMIMGGCFGHRKAPETTRISEAYHGGRGKD